MQSKIVELPDALWLQDYYKSFANPKSKIKGEVDRNNLIRLKSGRYLRADLRLQPRYLALAANVLYGPSYLSFQYALRWYGLIPEAVIHWTSATFRKNRKKQFDTPVGSFFYRDVPPRAYSAGLVRELSAQPGFLMACPEKALCDLLYTQAGIRALMELEALLFQNLRIDFDKFYELDRDLLRNLADLYRSETLETLKRYLGRIKDA